MDLRVYRSTDSIAVNPYSFDAGNGPGIDTVGTILTLARASGCMLDAGNAGGPLYLVGLPATDADLLALLQLTQVIPNHITNAVKG